MSDTTKTPKGREPMGSPLRDAREKNGLTQQQLADALGITASMVCHFENDRRRPSLDRLVEMSVMLGFSVDDVLGLTA